MTMGGPQILGGGGDISAIGVNDTVGDLLGGMQSKNSMKKMQ